MNYEKLNYLKISLNEFDLSSIQLALPLRCNITFLFLRRKYNNFEKKNDIYIILSYFNKVNPIYRIIIIKNREKFCGRLEGRNAWHTASGGEEKNQDAGKVTSFQVSNFLNTLSWFQQFRSIWSSPLSLSGDFSSLLSNCLLFFVRCLAQHLISSNLVF